MSTNATPNLDIRQYLDHAYEGQLHCPTCLDEASGMEHTVHIEHVQVLCGDLGVKVTGHASVQPYRNEGGTLRGSDVRIVFFCEHGHRFAFTFSFHKGTTYISTEALEQLEETPERELLYPHELWRD